MNARDKRVEKAQLRVLFNVPFFAPGVARLEVVWDKSVQTACTDGKCIRWNPDWFDSLPDEVLPTVLCHEVCHPLLGHLWRAPAGADWDTWNQATDHAVNLMLTEFGEQVTGRHLKNPFPFPDPKEDYCCNPAFKGMPEEQIYSILSSNKPPTSGGKPGQGKASGKGPGAGQRGGKQNAPTGQGGGQAKTAGHKPFGEFSKPAGTPDQQKQSKVDWDSALMQSIQAAKGRGDVPGYLQRYVDELLNPTVPWYEIVRNWLREKAEDDWNWMKPNPYFDDSDFILPSLDSERMGPIVFATDTSGSIDQQLLAQFHVEKQNCLDEMKPSKLVDICCDTRITQQKEYRLGDRIDPKAPGGGGTDFRPVFDRLEELPEKPRCIVYLTDLDGAFPERHPDVPVLWVTWGGTQQAPFGEVVRVR